MTKEGGIFAEPEIEKECNVGRVTGKEGGRPLIHEPLTLCMKMKNTTAFVEESELHEEGKQMD